MAQRGDAVAQIGDEVAQTGDMVAQAKNMMIQTGRGSDRNTMHGSESGAPYCTLISIIYNNTCKYQEAQ